MASDDRKNATIYFYDQNGLEKMCHTTQIFPTFDYSDLSWPNFDLDPYLVWRIYSNTKQYIHLIFESNSAEFWQAWVGLAVLRTKMWKYPIF